MMMNQLSRFKTCSAFAGAVSLIALSGCANFRGLGPFETPASKAGVNPKETAISAPSEAEQPELALSGARSTTQQPASDIQLDWPVDEARMTRAFFASHARKKRPHWGLDLANHRGTPIMAAEKGTIIYTGKAFHGYGRLIVIEHNQEWATMYAHLDKILVKEGQTVDKGEKIALMGRSGNARGVHLHFEVRHHRQPVNPLAYLPNAASAVAGAPQKGLLQLTSQGSLSEHQDKP